MNVLALNLKTYDRQTLPVDYTALSALHYFNMHLEVCKDSTL